jgi:4-hydroxy-tetrahydrodipicolinate reductase
MKPYSEYKASIEETHHTQKKDAPSGTAITLAEGSIKNIPLKKKWELNKPEIVTHSPDSIVINSFRVDPAPGTHTVKYQSVVDDIEITHTAHSRQGFAWGAVVVAEWMKGKKGVFKMDDFLGL